VFENFKQNYTGIISSSQSNLFDVLQINNTGTVAKSVSTYCNKNFAFRPHSSGWDISGSVNIFNSKCINCDSDSYLLADAPNQKFLGWFGGCGDIVCTGLLNYLITDWNGAFFGSTGSIIPDQSNVIGVNEKCTYSQSMNAYMCPKRLDFSVLEYQNIAADFKTRIMWPVSLTADGTNYTTLTNGWRDW
jgi:hypothetical protein